MRRTQHKQQLKQQQQQQQNNKQQNLVDMKNVNIEIQTVNFNHGLSGSSMIRSTMLQTARDGGGGGGDAALSGGFMLEDQSNGSSYDAQYPTTPVTNARTLNVHQTQTATPPSLLSLKIPNINPINNNNNNYNNNNKPPSLFPILSESRQ